MRLFITKNVFFLTFLYLFLLSCTKKTEGSTSAATAMDTIHKTYLALGDSYTIGESVPASERFPVQTQKLLQNHNIDVSNPDIIAVTGWTTGNLLNSLDNAPPPKKNYTIVSLLIGVNNQYQGKTLDEYKTQFATLLDRAIVYAGNNKNHVFVLSIPDYSVTPFASGSDTAKIAREIDAFNFANKTISQDRGVHYIDITPASREAKNNAALIAGDGLHPSALQYEKWSEVLAPAILQEIH